MKAAVKTTLLWFDECGVEEGEDAEELVQRLLWVDVRRRVKVAIAARVHN